MKMEAEPEIGRAVFREANDAFFVVRPDDLSVCEVNPAAQRLTGLRRKELLQRTLPDVIEAEEAKTLADLVHACQTSNCFESTTGLAIKTADGGRRDVHVSVSRIHTEPKTLALLIVRDISRQRQTERELRRSEARNRALLEAIPDLMFRLTGDGTFVDYHAAPGYLPLVRPEEFIGKRVTDVVPPQLAEQIMECVARVLATGRMAELEYPLKNYEGELRHWETRFVRCCDSEVVAIVRDTTEQVRATERVGGLLRKVVHARDDERARISRELHDATGQSLTCLLFGLRALMDSTSAQASQEQARELHRFAAQTLDEIQQMSRSLRPSVLADLGLVPALQSLAADCRRIYGLDARLQFPRSDHGRLPPLVETTIYRIAQEAVTNVARHARAAHVTFALETSGDRVNFLVTDDGHGFDVERAIQSLDSSRHLGLSTMEERAELLGGTFTVESEIGRGTRICVAIPVQQESAEPLAAL